MATIQDSLNEFKKRNFALAEKIAIENIATNPKNMAQILATIFKITGHLDILSAPDDAKLPVIREIAPWEYEEKNFESAKFFYNEILKITPNDDVALNNLGLIYEDLKDYAKFKNILLNFQRLYGIEKYNLKDLDRYLWQLGKKYFPNNYGK